MNSELFVKRPSDTTFTSLDLYDDVPYSVTYAVADIRNPENRNGSYSKTITIPGTATNNAVFEFIFNVNVALQTFDPNLKCDAFLRQEGVDILTGYLQIGRAHV